MKKVFFVSLLLLAFAFLTSACSRPTTLNSPGSQNNKQSDPRRPDFGQPEREPDIRGLVKSISGNEVTILKVDLRGGFRSGTSTSDRATSSPSASLVPSSQEPRGGFEFRNNRNQSNGNQRTDMLAKMKEMSTGEEKITIPVGIRMLKPESGSIGKERKVVEASLSDISADKVITVWFNEGLSDSKIAEFVLIN